MNFKSKSRRYSRQSVLCALDKFVEAVDNMNETVLVPARLMDISAQDDCNDIGYDNYYHCYCMLNAVKNELLWGGIELQNSDTAQNIKDQSSINRRRLSITSSLSLSDSDSDSVISETSSSASSSSSSSSSSSLAPNLPSPDIIVRNLRHHMFGLNDALNRLSNAAIVLTCKYQEDIGVHTQS